MNDEPNNGYNYKIGKACMRALEAHGWQHIATLICGEPADNRFGMLYSRNDTGITETFYLNKNTYKTLPIPA